MAEVIELQALPGTTSTDPSKQIVSKQNNSPDQETSLELGEQNQPQGRATEILQQWNKPQINVWRYLACLLGFVIMGANDAAYGVTYVQTCHQRSPLTVYRR